MFRIEFFVDDKKLGNALHALVGIAHGQPNVQPVSNAMKRQNGLVPIIKGGSSVEQMVHAIQKAKLTQVNVQQAGQLLKTIGLKPGSATYMLRRVAAAGFLQKVGKGNNVVWQLRGKG